MIDDSPTSSQDSDAEVERSCDGVAVDSEEDTRAVEGTDSAADEEYDGI